MMHQPVPKWQYRFGLIGQRLDYSFSPAYFKSIFEKHGLEMSHHYVTWPLPDEAAVRSFFHARAFEGCNVTIPYKLLAAELCDVLVGHAAEIGAVNTVARDDDKLIGYNTDVYGVLKSFESLLETDLLQSDDQPTKQVMILGTGGASKAVQCACRQLNWPYVLVSRTGRPQVETYRSIQEKQLLESTDLLINTTPLGMVGYENQMPPIPIEAFRADLMVFDLIYTPKKTLILSLAEKAGARFINGELMLREQANLAWNIWNQITNRNH